MKSLKLYPVSQQSRVVIEKAEFALVGISPFNSYFSVENIIAVLHTVVNNFNDFAIFIPDQISQFTLQALGYDAKRVSIKVRKQDNYLKNKANKALLEIINYYKLPTSNRIITLSGLLNNISYLTSYNSLMEKFNDDNTFKDGCVKTSYWVISNYKQNNSIADSKALMIAVQYFLKELPIFLCSPKILNVNSCCFIYPTVPAFLNEIYNAYDITSKNQGFAIIK